MSKQTGMDAQKDLQDQYITAETLYMTHLREAYDVVKFTTPVNTTPVRLIQSAMSINLRLIQSAMRFGGGQVFQKTNTSALSLSRMVY